MPESLFDRVQEVLHSRTKAGEKQRTHHRYLKGSDFCARFGSRLRLTLAKGRATSTSSASGASNAARPAPCRICRPRTSNGRSRSTTAVRPPEDVQQSIPDGLKAELDQQRRQAAPEIA